MNRWLNRLLVCPETLDGMMIDWDFGHLPLWYLKRSVSSPEATSLQTCKYSVFAMWLKSYSLHRNTRAALQNLLSDSSHKGSYIIVGCCKEKAFVLPSEVKQAVSSCWKHIGHVVLTEHSSLNVWKQSKNGHCLQLPSAKPLKDLDYVAAAKFSPFHEWNSTRPKERSTVIYRPPQRSLFQLVDPKLQTQPKTQQLSGVPPKFDESRVFRPIPELASQSSNFSNESVLQNASYFYSQESLYG